MKNKIIDINTIVKKFEKLRVGVIGDMILDRYILGDATRISPEAPIPIVLVEKKTMVLGGAANVINNLCHLGSKCKCYGVIGKDFEGEFLTKMLNDIKCDTTGLIADENRCTTVKTRVLAGKQQIVRIDEEHSHFLPQEIQEKLIKSVKKDIKSKKIDALIFEDYNKGVFNENMVQELVNYANEFGVLTSIDPHPGNKMIIKGFSFMTPNRNESFALANEYYTKGILPIENDKALLKVGKIIMQNWQPRMLVTTLGPDGMAIFRKGKAIYHIPTLAKSVFDVSGAGDTVIGTFMLSLLAGCSDEDAADIANHAAGVVVGFVGTVPITTKLLLESY